MACHVTLYVIVRDILETPDVSRLETGCHSTVSSLFMLALPRFKNVGACSWSHISLSALATDAAGQLDVLGHDGHALGVDGSQVGVLEQAHQVGLSSLLQGQHGAALEAQVRLEVLWGFLTPPVAGADLRAALVASCLRGALPPVDLRAVCLVRAMVANFFRNVTRLGTIPVAFLYMSRMGMMSETVQERALNAFLNTSYKYRNRSAAAAFFNTYKLSQVLYGFFKISYVCYVMELCLFEICIRDRCLRIRVR